MQFDDVPTEQQMRGTAVAGRSERLLLSDERNNSIKIGGWISTGRVSRVQRSQMVLSDVLIPFMD